MTRSEPMTSCTVGEGYNNCSNYSSLFVLYTSENNKLILQNYKMPCFSGHIVNSHHFYVPQGVSQKKPLRHSQITCLRHVVTHKKLVASRTDKEVIFF